ncbi:MAG: methyltransferase domain-containing protein [Acidobacteria bacterium]|nr:methyltransferase domain-containing protein [Acidobacteriota bacterium]
MKVPSRIGDGPPQPVEGRGREGNPVARVSVIEGHALWAKTYDRDPNPLLALEERELEPLLPDLSGKSVLDVACGTGRWLRKLLWRGAREGVGVDLSTEMLACAGRKIALRGRLIRADCLALPLREGWANLAICSFAAGYIKDVRPLARDLARVCRRSARVFVTDFHPSGHLRGWRRAFRNSREMVEIMSFAHSLETLRRDFTESGFEFRRLLEPRLSSPERRIFVESGKESSFETVQKEPAIYIFEFAFGGASALENIP